MSNTDIPKDLMATTSDASVAKFWATIIYCIPSIRQNKAEWKIWKKNALQRHKEKTVNTSETHDSNAYETNKQTKRKCIIDKKTFFFYT